MLKPEFYISTHANAYARGQAFVTFQPASAAAVHVLLLQLPPPKLNTMLRKKLPLLRPANITARYCVQILRPHAHRSPCIAAAAAKPAEVASAVAPFPPRRTTPGQNSRVLFVGGLPGAVDASLLQQQLAAACAQWQPTRVEVMALDDM